MLVHTCDVWGWVPTVCGAQVSELWALLQQLRVVLGRVGGDPARCCHAERLVCALHGAWAPAVSLTPQWLGLTRDTWLFPPSCVYVCTEQQPEHLDKDNMWLCDGCKKKVCARKQMTIARVRHRHFIVYARICTLWVAWVHGCIGAWMGCMDAWMHGYGCMGAWAYL